MKKDSGGDPSTRLEQRSEERTSLSRGSLGKGSLTGRFSLTGAIAGSAAGPSSYLGGSDAVSLGGSSAATRHWVNSVSDIYGPDEIEELLEDLNRLELAAGASFTDDEEPVVADLGYALGPAASQRAVRARIAPSEHDDRLHSLDSACAAHRSQQSPLHAHAHQQRTNRKKQTALSDPLTGDQMLIEGWGHDTCDNQDVVARVRLPPSPVTGQVIAEDVPMQRMKASFSQRQASPTFSVRSWDSHVHYQHDDDDDLHPAHMADGAADQDPGGLFATRSKESVACYCDIATFKNPRTLLRVLLVVTSISCLSTILTLGTAKLGLFELPHFPRLRVMMFVSVFTIVFTVFIIFLNISHLHVLLPISYGKMQTVVYLILVAAYVAASTLVFQVHSEGDSRWSGNQLLAIGILGVLCAFECLLCCFNGSSAAAAAAKGDDDTSQLPYDKMVPESSTHFTLQETTSSRGRQPPQKQQQQQQSSNSLHNENYSSSQQQQQHNNPNFRTEGHTHAKYNQHRAPESERERHSSSSKSRQPPDQRQADHHHRHQQQQQQRSRQHHSNSSSKKPKSSTVTLTATIEQGQVPPPPPSSSSRHDNLAAAGSSSRHSGGGGGNNNPKPHPPPPPASSHQLRQKQVPANSKNAASNNTERIPPDNHTAKDLQHHPKRPTGAIPKTTAATAVTESTNHVDEIVTLPLDDFSSRLPPAYDSSNGQSHHHHKTSKTQNGSRREGGSHDAPL